MRVKSATIQQFILGIALLLALCWNLAQANEINELKISTGATGTRAEIALRSSVPFRTLTLANPDRLVVDLPGTGVSPALRMPAAAGAVKAVRRGQPEPGTTRIVFDLAAPITVIKPRIETDVSGAARLVLEWPGDGPVAAMVKPALTPPSTPASAATSTTGGAVVAVASQPTNVSTQAPAAGAIDVPAGAAPTGTARAGALPATHAATTKTQPTVASTAAAPAQTPPVPPPAQSVAVRATKGGKSSVGGARSQTSIAPPASPAVTKIEPPSLPAGRTLQDLRVGTRPLIIAIDAGHGGQDPGAHGPSGKREKDVTLVIARELARQIDATPGLKAYLTRDSDMFLPLTKRTQLARAAKADMFVSIHADAAENRAARGASVFVLSLRGASSQRARWLADKENAADMIGGVRVPQADNTLASVLLDLTQSGQMKASESAAAHVLDGLKGIGDTHKPHVERANFAVLRTSDMPAMLVETAFISNPDEERKLFDPDYQRQLARAVLNGVDLYFTRQPPPGTLYAARAKAAQDTPVQVAKAQGSTGGSP